VKWYFWSIALYGAGTWTFRKVDQKFIKIFEMRYEKRMEKISWADSVRKEEEAC
jgi:hypothetical protein